MKARANLDLYLGSPVLPSQVRRVRTDHRGALCFYVESEDHDLGLLRSLAAAVRDEPETIARLREYADLMDALDAAEREDSHKLRRSLEDEAVDLRGQIEADMEWQDLGETHVASLRPEDSSKLLEALLGLDNFPTEQAPRVPEGSAA